MKLERYAAQSARGARAWLGTNARPMVGGWERLEPGERSEAVLLLRRLVGLEPLPAWPAPLTETDGDDDAQ